MFDLGYQLSNRIVVRIYPDLSEFHNAIGFPDAPNHLIAVGRIDGIYIVSPEFMTSAVIVSPEKVILHEFVHVMTGNLFGPRPAWLCEGIASFMSEDIPDVKGYISSDVKTGSMPSLDDLNSNYDSFIANKGYPFSYTVIEFIVDTYGFGKLLSFFEKPDDFEGLFNLSKDEFQREWHEFLQKNY